MQNLSNNDTQVITLKFNQLLEAIYKKKITSTRRLNFDKLHIIYPNKKVYVMDIKYFKNAQKFLSYFFANIDKKPFIDRNHNIYAFEALWLLLAVIDRIHGFAYKDKELFLTGKQVGNISNTIQFGKYLFTIPKYKQFIFNVMGTNMAQLTVV